MIKKFYYKSTQSGYQILVVPCPSNVYGTTTGSGLYFNGDVVTIGALPNNDFKFLLWRDNESISTTRTITVSCPATYDALFYLDSNLSLRIVDSDLNLYSYSEYDALSTKPVTIGVAIKDGTDWLVYYKNYIGSLVDSTGAKGYKINPTVNYDTPLPLNIFIPLTSLLLMLPHPGKSMSDLFKSTYNVTGAAAYEAGQLTDGGLDWYIPNLYECISIFNRKLDSSANANDGFDSHFLLIGGDQIAVSSTLYNHAHWCCDFGYTGGTGNEINPYRVIAPSANNQMAYWSNGNYHYANNFNYVRPVARISAINLVYDDNGSDSGTVPFTQTVYKTTTLTVSGNTGNLQKSGQFFIGWNTAPDGSGTSYNVGDSIILSSTTTLYALWGVTTITINYGSNGSYVGLNTTEIHLACPGDVISNLDNDFDDLTSRDLSDYGLTWDGKFYYDSSFTQLVAEPYTVTLNITFYVNIVDTVKYGIKVKGSGPENFNTIDGVSPFGLGHDYIQARSYTDNENYYNIATIGQASAFNVEYADESIDHIYIPNHVTDLSLLKIRHNTCDLTITYSGNSSQFLSAVNGNSIWNSSYYTNIVICTDHNLTYDFTNQQWIVIS